MLRNASKIEGHTIAASDVKRPDVAGTPNMFASAPSSRCFRAYLIDDGAGGW
jgi:hypothetical protein